MASRGAFERSLAPSADAPFSAPRVSGLSGIDALSPAGRIQPSRPARFCQISHPEDIALPLGHRDYPASVKEIEDVAGLDALVVGRKSKQVIAFVTFFARLQKRLALALCVIEMPFQQLCVGIFKVEP
jgi:hypothetical protein